jgi:hypothetical protein
MLAVEGHGNTLQLWEVLTGKQRGEVRLPSKYVRRLALSPDGRLLAAGDTNGNVHLWGLAEGKVLARIVVGRLSPDSRAALVFSPDGRTLATLGDDTAILLWKVDVPQQTERPPGRSRDVWADLSSEDAAKGWRAVRDLTASPRQAVRLLKERLRPATEPDAAVVARLLSDLDHDKFEVRERATNELRGLREVVEPDLRAALGSSPEPERRQRLERLLETLGNERLNHPPDAPRAERALEVLEIIGTPEAREVLEGLAKGAPAASLTREAKASLARLAARSR